MTRWRIARVQPDDVAGGAERMAQRLHQAVRQRGHVDHVFVGNKRSLDPDVFVVDNRARQGSVVGLAARAFEHASGIPFAYFPGSRALVEQLCRYDVVHLHNLHGDFFELRRVPELAARVPVVVTLHDLFWATGHCAQPMDCPRWSQGCGHCPDLARYPMVHRDATAFNRWNKRNLIARGPHQIIAPTQWIRDRWHEAGMPGPDPVVVPRGLDLEVYRPGDRAKARHQMGLETGRSIVMFSAQGGIENTYKDGQTVIETLRRLMALTGAACPTLLVLGGGRAEFPADLQAHIHRTGFLDDTAAVVRCYQAADVLLHATRADNSPLVIIEAMACGLPVVANAIGGIAELVVPGETGWLSEAGDVESLTHQVQVLLDDSRLATDMGARARARARTRHDVQRYVDRVLEVYAEARRRCAAGPTRGNRRSGA
ncbi:MAG: glycosyltransferase [Pseudomonadota bacterium]